MVINYGLTHMVTYKTLSPNNDHNLPVIDKDFITR